jgi:hypothetical protein
MHLIKNGTTKIRFKKSIGVQYKYKTGIDKFGKYMRNERPNDTNIIRIPQDIIIMNIVILTRDDDDNDISNLPCFSEKYKIITIFKQFFFVPEQLNK